MGLLIAGIIAFHVILVHAFSSSNPIINPLSTTLTPSLLYTSIKDVIILAYSLLLYSITLILNPDAVGNCDNNIAADPFTTPHNILPE
jgi:quinol-cytochrome oxidoreductase complex cytochrome b subunit